MPKFEYPNSKDTNLYGILLLDGVVILTTQDPINQIRIPAFGLLLFFLIQVIYPQFRFSKKANLIASLTILALALLNHKIY